MQPQGTEDRREGGRQLLRKCDQRLGCTGRMVSNPMKRKIGDWRVSSSGWSCQRLCDYFWAV